MSLELILFFVLAIIAIATALGMLLSRSAVYSALYLVVNFVSVAIFYLLLDAPFIALSQIAVYAGAIMVLFLFVIMLIGLETLGGELNWRQLVWPLAMGILLLVQGVFLVIQRVGRDVYIGQTGTQLSDPSLMARVLFTDYLLPFQVTAVLLLVAMIGAIVLSKREKSNQEA
ncbi:MAG: NADH-quinone oxidoreductase subunit J [Anaerolineales bacterium]|nr:NADH-quinone oxidoreductase subunit J [Anaerolineales bacterium]MDW8276741.1 NADH-quinone oxidoreductase subunit J [Anaerolineales bacterium]